MEEENKQDTSLSASDCLKSLGQIFGKQATLPPVVKRYTQEQFMEQIEKNYGIVTMLCSKLDCTAKQFYNAIDHWKLRDYLKQCKQQLVGVAEQTILNCLTSSTDSIKLKAAEITLKSLGKEEWSQGPQVQIHQAILTDKEKSIEIKNIFGIPDSK